jgi:hypothetical protein
VAITVEWISNACNESPVNIISKPFLKLILSDVEDGPQDGMLSDENPSD